MYHIDGSKTLRQPIQWYKDILLVIEGMGIKDAEQMVPLIEQRCEGSAQAAFQDMLTHVSSELLSEVDQQVEKEVGEQQTDETAEAYEERCTEARTRLEKTTGKLTKKDIDKCLQKVIELACPYKVLRKQRKYMRRYMCKPRDMNIRQFVNAVSCMNNNELLFLPPFEANQSLPEDDVNEIVLHACPNSWIQEMD
jgi:thioredoxin-like negative regulator of GroEL